MSETLQPNSYEEIPINESLALQALDVSQAEELFSITDANREYLGQWLPWVNQTLTAQDSAEFITQTVQKRKMGSEFGFGIILDNKVVGHISLMHVTDKRDPEIGYWISQDASGSGLTSSAALAVTDFAFHSLQLDKVIIRANPKNIASNKIAEKLGYTLERQDPYDSEGLLNIWAKYRA
jgi:ribosomal-protein-serine acetyltransferase